ncbi:hypothetical protein BBJ28_00003074 [Nothophytophthora sp. Chile5]|nr:hypothetical protein BBJ28_00003074 [Nothophytophthora sp. Chile5]
MMWTYVLQITDLPLLIEYIHDEEGMAIGVEVLALICGTEDFDSHSDYYVDSPETESALISLHGRDACTDDLLTMQGKNHFTNLMFSLPADDYLEEATEDYDVRKRLRPLLDAVRELSYHRK